MQSTSTISFSVVDRRTGNPAVGMGVELKCLSPVASTFLGRIDSSGGVLDWIGLGKPTVVSSLASFLATNTLQPKKWTVEFMTTTFFEPMQPAYHSATGRVHLNFSLQPEEQIHIVLLADIYGFSTHIQVTKLGRQQLKPRPYTGLSSSQNKALMDHCNDEPYPSHSSYLKLSQRLDIPREQTVKWFQRARARNRQSLQIPPFGPVIKEINSTKQPKQKQSGSAELRSPYMLRAKHPRVMLGQSPPKVESGRIGSASEKSVDGEDTILVNHPASTVGMTLVEENNRFVRRSTRAGGN